MQKRLKLQNQVIAELVEALRVSTLSHSRHYSDTLTNTLEENRRIITRLAFTKCSKCSGAKKQIEELILFGITKEIQYNDLDVWLQSTRPSIHSVTGDYDCCSLCELIPVILVQNNRINEVVRFFRRLIAEDKQHENIILFHAIHYLLSSVVLFE